MVNDTCRMVRISVDKLVDGLGGSPLRHAAILVKDGVIVQVGTEQEVEAPDAAEVVRFPEGSTAVPGLVDAHVHLTFDPASAQATSDGADVHAQVAAARGRANTAARAGVLTLFDCGATAPLTARLRDRRPAAGLPRILMSGPPVTPPGGHCDYLGGATDTTAEAVRRKVQELVALGVDGVKLMATGGIMTPKSNPLEPALPGDLVRTVTDEAHRHGLRVTAHAHAVAGMRVCADNGVDSLEHASMIGPAGEWEFDMALARDLAERGVRCVSTLTPGTDADRDRRLASVPNRRLVDALAYQTRIRNFSALRQEGVQVVAGSDVGTPATDFGHQLHAELVALVDAGFTPMDALCAATSEAARHLGIEDEVGSLQRGRLADVVVVSEDPTTDIRRMGAVQAVFAHGLLLEGMPDQTRGGTNA